MTDMTQAQTPEALCLADACLDDWDLVRPHLVVDMLRTQHAHIAQLEAELVKEAARTAAEKLRADQMTQRLDMANRLGNDARAELAQLRQAGKPVALTDAQIIEWWASENGLEDCDMAKREDFVSVVHAIQAKFGYTQEGASNAD